MCGGVHNQPARNGEYEEIARERLRHDRKTAPCLIATAGIVLVAMIAIVVFTGNQDARVANHADRFISSAYQ